jgi:phospholipase D
MDIIINNILAAKKTILVQAYVITSQKIVTSLIQAHQRQIEVRLLIDKQAVTSHGSKINLLLQSGIPITIERTLGIAHNKIMIIDDTHVITGSFNWTHSAQTRNAENVVVIRGQAYCKRFKANWYKRATAGQNL